MRGPAVGIELCTAAFSWTVSRALHKKEGTLFYPAHMAERRQAQSANAGHAEFGMCFGTASIASDAGSMKQILEMSSADAARATQHSWRTI
mmetsp:Transcript_6698/g.19261  ORF Transcript_6698/g.19261 Transcript_6698/m.19261 type:complete len:91 (-) Transcript_6698:164-436(-)